MSQLVPETCWTITTQRADHPHTLWNIEILCYVEFSSTSTFTKMDQNKDRLSVT